MVEKSTRCAYQYNTTFSKSCLFTLCAFTTHDRGRNHVIEQFQKSSQFDIDLHGELSCWRKDDGHSSRFFSVDFLLCQTVIAQIFDERH